jgi:hypothetical protein
MDAIPPTLPFHLAKAYGVKPTAPASTPTPTVTVTPVGLGVDRIDSVRTAERAGLVDKADLNAVKKAEAIRSKLVAATVPGGVEFRNGVATASVGGVARKADAIPFYRHPADKNAAATAIDLGTRLDLEG